MLESVTLEANKVPIYIQLREQILRAVGAGLLVPGQQLPTVREVATVLCINGSTVQQAYAELERDGVIVIQRGRGTFVADSPPPTDPALRGARLDELAHKTVAAAKAQGFGSVELFSRIVLVDPEF